MKEYVAVRIKDKSGFIYNHPEFKERCCYINKSINDSDGYSFCFGIKKIGQDKIIGVVVKDVGNHVWIQTRSKWYAIWKEYIIFEGIIE